VDVLIIIAVLTMVALIWWLSAWMQAYSKKKYRFPLFNFVTFSLMVVGWIFALLSIYTLPEGGSLTEVISAIRSFSFPEPLSNSIVLFVLATIFFAGVLLILLIKTNPLFGTIAWSFQLIASALVIPFLIFLIPGGKKKKPIRHDRRRKRQY